MPTLTHDGAMPDAFYVPSPAELAAFYARAGTTLMGASDYSVALDNHDPQHRGHREAVGTLYHFTHDTCAHGIQLYGADWRDWTSALYLIDDGHAVRPFYVACYRAPMVHDHPITAHHAASLVLHPMPTPNDRRPVDFSQWSLGPRRAYHFKLSPMVPASELVR